MQHAGIQAGRQADRQAERYFMFLFLCLSVSLCLCVSVSLCLLCVSVSLRLLCVSVSLCLRVCVSMCLRVYVSLCLCISLYRRSNYGVCSGCGVCFGGSRDCVCVALWFKWCVWRHGQEARQKTTNSWTARAPQRCYMIGSAHDRPSGKVGSSMNHRGGADRHPSQATSQPKPWKPLKAL